MSHLVGEPQPVQKVTIVSRGQALGYTLNTPQEDRYLHTKEELLDLHEGAARRPRRRADRLRRGHERRRERPRARHRRSPAPMVFEFGMGEEVSSRTMRADNYALSEQTKQLRDDEQARLTDHAYGEAVRLLAEAPRARSTGSRPRCSRRRRSSAPSSRSCSVDVALRVERLRPRRHAARRLGLRLTRGPSR